MTGEKDTKRGRGIPRVPVHPVLHHRPQRLRAHGQRRVVVRRQERDDVQHGGRVVGERGPAQGARRHREPRGTRAVRLERAELQRPRGDLLQEREPQVAVVHDLLPVVGLRRDQRQELPRRGRAPLHRLQELAHVGPRAQLLEAVVQLVFGDQPQGARQQQLRVQVVPVDLRHGRGGNGRGQGRALLEGGHRGSPGAVAERSHGMGKRLGEAVSGGWKCGWGSCWGTGMSLGESQCDGEGGGGGGHHPLPPLKRFPGAGPGERLLRAAGTAGEGPLASR